MKKGIVCDLDETLISARAVHEPCLKEALARCGFSINRFKWTYGLTASELAINNFPKISKSEIEKVELIKKRLLKSYIFKAKKLPGAEALLKFAKDKKIKSAIVTNNSKHDLKALLMHLGWSSYFDFYLTEDDGPNKPNPFLLNKGVRRMNLKKEEVIYLGDSDSDILACKRSEIEMILIQSVHKEAKLKKESKYVVPNLKEALKILKEITR